MQVNKILLFTGDNTPPISCPINGAFELVVSGMSGTDSLIIQKSSDNGATWTTHTTVSADGTARAIADAGSAVGIRAIASVFNAGHAWTVGVKNVLDIGGVTPLTRMDIEYIWDFAVHGGAIGNFTITPSKAVPANTVCIGLFIEVLTAVTGGAGAILKLGLTGNLACLSDNIITGPQAAGFVYSDMFQAQTREIFIDHNISGAVDVKGQITDDTFTAGKVRMVAVCLSHGL